jgi:hypothetical protein
VQYRSIETGFIYSDEQVRCLFPHVALPTNPTAWLAAAGFELYIPPEPTPEPTADPGV